ncbi:MAG: hypothetical protein NVV73_10890 [Cellvibrionaceae bacterium]|nr:hypothetical protein [Cellvibrionaceae bacterium]
MSENNLTQEQISIKNHLNFLSIGAGAIAALIVGALIWFAYIDVYPTLGYVFVVLAGAAAFVVVGVAGVQCPVQTVRRGFCSELGGYGENIPFRPSRKREQESGRFISGPNEGKRLITVTTWTEEPLPGRKNP